jgi:hypothetical protein
MAGQLAAAAGCGWQILALKTALQCTVQQQQNPALLVVTHIL